MDAELKGLEQSGLSDEDEVVAAWKVFAEQTEFTQAFAGHEMGVVDDGHEHLACAVYFVCFLNEEFFTAMVGAGEVDMKGVAEDAQGVVIGVECAVDDGCDEAFGVVFDEGLFEYALAGAWFSKDETEASLLGVNLEDVEDFLLMSQEGDGIAVEGVAGETKVRSDHDTELS